MPRELLAVLTPTTGFVVAFFVNARGQDSCAANVDAIDCAPVI